MAENRVVTVAVEVCLDPTAAFETFTAEIDRWWRPGPQNWNNRFHAVGIRIEPVLDGGLPARIFAGTTRPA